MKKYLFLICIVWGSTSLLSAQKKDKGQKVSAQIEVLMEGNYSKAALQEKAIKAARVKAMGDAFGYAIVQGISTQTKSTSGDEILTSTTINEVSNTLVKGEWIADDPGYPKPICHPGQRRRSGNLVVV
ncbi:MAG: hypothetical protein HC880_02610 [Bacteroidia bacterium]|nr:hypothetical protein [Bacteroidia bacterium]